jgi:glutathione S-transferase
MKLYWCERTRAVRAVWMMEELGVPYERVRIDIRNEQSRADPAFRVASPMGKVPALEDGAVRIWDSGAICAYLADQYPTYGWGSWEQMLATLRTAVARGPWILGERFSAADVLLGMSCSFMRQFKMITDEPELFAYADRCAARPAFQRAYALEAQA